MAGQTPSACEGHASTARSGSEPSAGPGWSGAWALAAAGVFVLAAVLRLWMLGDRPPHHDEGVNGLLVERVMHLGYYPYDPSNYHGPLHYYLLTLSRLVLGHGILALRLPLALLGIALCAMPLLLTRRLGRPAALVASLLLATSPTLVYYARDAIHETLFVLLALGVLVALERWLEDGRPRALAAAVVLVGLMVATKETAPLLAGPIAAVLLGEHLLAWRQGRPTALGAPLLRRSLPWLAVGLLAAAAVHVLLFTGAFRAPGGTWDTLRRSLESYFRWAGTSSKDHLNGPLFYLRILGRHELPLVLLALLGAVRGWRVRLVRDFALAAALVFLEHQLIPYKTPWLSVGWVALLAVPAGHGAAGLARSGLGLPLAAFAPRLVPLAAGVLVSLGLAGRLSFRHAEDPDELLPYAQTSREYLEWTGVIHAAMERYGPGALQVRLLTPVTLWPIPWTLSPYPRVEYGIPGTVVDADVVAIQVSGQEGLEQRLRDIYYRKRFVMRPGTEDVVVYFRARRFKDVLEALHPGLPGYERTRAAQEQEHPLATRREDE